MEQIITDFISKWGYKSDIHFNLIRERITCRSI